MKTVQLSILTATSVLALVLSSAQIAHADGMPYYPQKQKPMLTPLDQALDNIQNQAPPIDVTAPPAETKVETTTTTVAHEEPAALPPPVPETRVVEVQPNTSFFGFSVGMYDPFSHGEQAASFNAEWQPSVKIAGILQPLFGAMATTNGALLGYGGVGVPFHVGKHIFVMPSAAVGAYKEGAGYDLDRTLVYRVGTEIAYEFDNKSRLGINAHVITNGESTKREDRTEVIGLVYTMPMNLFSGGKGRTEMAAPVIAPVADTSTTTTTTTTTMPTN